MATWAAPKDAKSHPTVALLYEGIANVSSVDLSVDLEAILDHLNLFVIKRWSHLELDIGIFGRFGPF